MIRLFKGSASDYLRLRAKKHRTNYNDPKQADVLDGLADDVDKLHSERERLMEALTAVGSDLDRFGMAVSTRTFNKVKQTLKKI